MLGGWLTTLYALEFPKERSALIASLLQPGHLACLRVVYTWWTKQLTSAAAMDQMQQKPTQITLVKTCGRCSVVAETEETSRHWTIVLTSRKVSRCHDPEEVEERALCRPLEEPW